MSGTLFYLMGASGCGKDALLSGCRVQLPARLNCGVAHRYITRAPQAGGENHVQLSEAEFLQRQQQGLFAMHWHSHGYHYGIGIEIDSWLASGMHVVVNGSRAYLDEARSRYAQLVPVLVDVDDQLLRQRLLKRGREPIAEIEQRLTRHAQMMMQMPANTLRVCNSGSLDAGIAALLQVVTGHCQATTLNGASNPASG